MSKPVQMESDTEAGYVGDGERKELEHETL